MRTLLLSLMLALSACGDDDDSSGSSDPDYDIIRANGGVYCDDVDCTLDLEIEHDIPKKEIEGWQTALVLVDSSEEIESCLSEDTPDGAEVLIEEADSYSYWGLPPDTVFSFRICLFKAEDDFYSEGAADTFTTPSLEVE